MPFPVVSRERQIEMAAVIEGQLRERGFDTAKLSFLTCPNGTNHVKNMSGIGIAFGNERKAFFVRSDKFDQGDCINNLTMRFADWLTEIQEKADDPG